MTGWALAPGVLHLSGDRLAGGSPFRVVRLTERGSHQLHALLGTSRPPPPPIAGLTEQLVRYGLLLEPPLQAATIADVTVVIPARSDPDPVQAVLDAIPPAVPVVVVDDGSPRPLAGAVKRAGSTLVRHVRHDVARGPAAARNAGAALATTRWIVFVDADMALTPGWLARLVAYAGDGVLAVGPRVRSGASPGLGGLVEEYAGGLDLGAVAADVAVGGPVGYLPSAVLLVDAAAFRRVGGFDADLHVAEDVDLVWRLLDLGRVRYCPDVVALHTARGGLGAVLRRRWFYGTGAARLDARHPGVVRHADVSVYSFVPFVLAILARPWLGGLAAAGTVAVAPRTFRALPARDAVRLAAYGQATATASLGRYTLRPLWPLTVALCLLVPRRRGVLVGALLAGLADVVRRARRDDAVTWPSVPTVVLAHVLDDLAYSLGVWDGCLRTRRFLPLLPRVRTGRTAG